MNDNSLGLAEAIDEILACLIGIVGGLLHAKSEIPISRSNPGVAEPHLQAISAEASHAIARARLNGTRPAMREDNQVSVPVPWNSSKEIRPGIELCRIAGSDGRNHFRAGD